MVREVISGLRLQGPYDTETEVSLQASRDALMATQCFRDWNHTRKLCGSKVVIESDAHLLSAIRSVLNMIGLKLEATATRKGKRGGPRGRSYTYKLGAQEVTKMRELIGLRQKDSVASGREADIMA